MSDCEINGKRCTACCEAIHLPKSAVLLASVFGFINAGDGDRRFITRYWVRISSDEARYINPYPWDLPGFLEQADAGELDFFRCTLLRPGEGCGAYDDRPGVCKGYPGYVSPETISLLGEGEYAEGCSPWVDLRELNQKLASPGCRDSTVPSESRKSECKS